MFLVLTLLHVFSHMGQSTNTYNLYTIIAAPFLAILQVKDVLVAAFQRFPRLRYVDEKVVPNSNGKKDVTAVLRGWSTNPSNQIRFHNQAMQCCKVSIRDISKRRALWHDRQAGAQPAQESAVDEAPARDPPQDRRSSTDSRTPAPATPPA